MVFGRNKKTEEKTEEKTEIEKLCQSVADIIYPDQSQKGTDDYLNVCAMDIEDIAIDFKWILEDRVKGDFNKAFVELSKIDGAKYAGLQIVLKHVMKNAKTSDQVIEFLEKSPKVKNLLRAIVFNEKRVPQDVFDLSKGQDPLYMKDFMARQKQKMLAENNELAKSINSAALSSRPAPPPPKRSTAS